MIVLQGYIVVPPADLEAVRAALPRHADLTRREAGCLKFEVTPDEADEYRFNVYEEFADQASFEAHQQRVQDSDWGRVTVNVARHYEIDGLD